MTAGSVCLVDIPHADITVKPQYSSSMGGGGAGWGVGGTLIFAYIRRLR